MTDVMCQRHPNKRTLPERASRRPYCLDIEEARAVAALFSDSPCLRRDPKVVAAYGALQQQSDRMFRALSDPHRVGTIQVSFTRVMNPYDTDAELISGVRSQGLLEVAAAGCHRDRLHPLMDCTIGGPYDRFRAVHDLLGHVNTGLGFSRYDEYAAWRTQDTHYTGIARLALASELHAEHSAFWVSGRMPEHKAFLLDPPVLDWARSDQAAS
jgi:hypothetical protein